MSPAMNAYIDANSSITVLSGLMARAGSEDEIAAVLAHEYAHGLMRHIAKRRRNGTSAALAGLLAGAAVGAMVEDSDNVGDWMRVGANIGSQAGLLVYSRAMENEADHLARISHHGE